MVVAISEERKRRKEDGEEFLILCLDHMFTGFYIKFFVIMKYFDFPLYALV